MVRKYRLFPETAVPFIWLLSIGLNGICQTGNGLTGTKWSARVAEDCTDSLVFLSSHRVRQYSCEAGESYNGTYTLNKDTVVITGTSASEDGDGQDHWRNWYLHEGNLLKPTVSQGYSHGKWEKIKPATTPAGYAFKKVGR